MNDMLKSSIKFSDCNNLEKRFCLFHVKLLPQSAWTATLAAVILHIIGMILELQISTSVGEMPLWPSVISTMIAFVLLGLMILFRKEKSLRFISTIYLINMFSIVIVLLITNPFYAAAAQAWSPFQAAKLGCLVSAALAPSFSVGLISIIAHAGSSVIQYYWFFSDALKEKLALGEPRAVIVFGIAGMLALIYRFRRIALEQEFSQLHSKVHSVRHLAQAFVRVRDLMNNPLQIIEISISLIRDQKNPEIILSKIEKAVAELRELNSLLTQYENDVDWQPENYSFDAGKELKPNHGDKK